MIDPRGGKWLSHVWATSIVMMNRTLASITLQKIGKEYSTSNLPQKDYQTVLPPTLAAEWLFFINEPLIVHCSTNIYNCQYKTDKQAKKKPQTICSRLRSPPTLYPNSSIDW